MMRCRALFWVAVGGLVFCAGCAGMPSVQRNEEISHRIRKDMVDFYENMAQAYYLLGYGYYRLHTDALAEKDEAAAERYRRNASLYKEYYEDLMQTVRLMRQSFGLPESESQPLPTVDEAVPTPKSPASGAAEEVFP